MNELRDMLNKFRNDKNWNTENRDGTHRFDEEIEWIESMVNSYADFFHLTPDEVAVEMEAKRTYSWPNYYQQSNFPPLDGKGVIGIFKTFADFYDYSREHFEGFRCPTCGDISYHPQECKHRIEKDGKCDWCSYGFFPSETKVFILESGFKAIPIFEPIIKETKQ